VPLPAPAVGVGGRSVLCVLLSSARRPVFLSVARCSVACFALRFIIFLYSLLTANAFIVYWLCISSSSAPPLLFLLSQRAAPQRGPR